MQRKIQVRGADPGGLAGQKTFGAINYVLPNPANSA
jgi:hypothetical protein